VVDNPIQREERVLSALGRVSIANRRIGGKSAWHELEVIREAFRPRPCATHSNMAPIRRYLRISKYSVLECRIYLESPSDSRWLLDSRDPVLPRVIAAVRPLVLPKLREENERLFMRKKGKPVKDVIAEGIYPLIFLV
jgi:hypothetical protein